MSDPKDSLTEKMAKKLEYLVSRPEPTVNQLCEIIELKFRRDNSDGKKLSDGCKAYLMFIYQYLKYGKQHFQYPTHKKSREMTAAIRGTKMEKTSLEIIRRVTGQRLNRYKSVLRNDYLKGQLDVVDGNTIMESSKVIDIKTSYSQFDFMKCVEAKLRKGYNYQMQGYLALTGKDYGEVYHVLPDFTEDFIEETKQKMIDILCPDGIITDQFTEEWELAENSMRFAHIPDEERLIYYTVDRDEKIISQIYEKVEICREWLSSFEQKHIQKIATQLSEWQRKQSSILLPPHG